MFFGTLGTLGTFGTGVCDGAGAEVGTALSSGVVSVKSVVWTLGTFGTGVCEGCEEEALCARGEDDWPMVGTVATGILVYEQGGLYQLYQMCPL